MNSFILNVYLKILRSTKIHLYILLNIILTLVYYIMDFMSTKDISKIDYGKDLLLWYDYHIVSTFGNSIYFITLGVLLWFFILLEVARYFRTNQDQGILLTHIVRPIKRSKYFYSVIIGVFFAFVTVVVINILLSYLLTILFFNFHSVTLLKMVLASIIYSLIHVACIIIILSFIVLLVKQTEFSFIISGIIVIILAFLILLKYPLENMGISNINTTKTLSVFVFSDSYPYLYLTREIFFVFNEPLALQNNLKIEFFELFKMINFFKSEPDLGFPLLKAEVKQILIPYYMMVVALIINGTLLFISSKIFNKIDIT